MYAKYGIMENQQNFISDFISSTKCKNLDLALNLVAFNKSLKKGTSSQAMWSSLHSSLTDLLASKLEMSLNDPKLHRLDELHVEPDLTF